MERLLRIIVGDASTITKLATQGCVGNCKSGKKIPAAITIPGNGEFPKQDIGIVIRTRYIVKDGKDQVCLYLLVC